MTQTNRRKPLTPEESVALVDGALPCGDCGCEVATPELHAMPDGLYSQS